MPLNQNGGMADVRNHLAPINFFCFCNAVKNSRRGAGKEVSSDNAFYGKYLEVGMGLR